MSRRNTLTELERPKTSDEQRPREEPEEDGVDGVQMRRAATNNDLADLELEALKASDATDWTKQLMGMIKTGGSQVQAIEMSKNSKFSDANNDFDCTSDKGCPLRKRAAKVNFRPDFYSKGI